MNIEVDGDSFTKEYKDGKKKVVLTHDSVFLNNDAVFVEYEDVLRSIFFTVFYYLKESDVVNKYFDLEEIEDLDANELYLWYIQRKDRELLYNFPVDDEIFEKACDRDKDTLKQFCVQLLYHELDSSDYYLEMAGKLNFMDVLKSYTKTDLKSKIYIYSECESSTIKKDIEKTFGGSATYVYGNIIDVLKENKITANSTFVFSDVYKVLALKEAGILKFSSVIIADWFQYNYEEDGKTLKIDLQELYKEDVFKYEFFNNVFQAE